MPREDYLAKASRYLAQGRLEVRMIAAGQIVASCRGDSGEVYSLGYRPGGWYCECPAKSRCAHLQALMLVALRPTGDAT